MEGVIGRLVSSLLVTWLNFQGAWIVAFVMAASSGNLWRVSRASATVAVNSSAATAAPDANAPSFFIE